MPQRDVGLPPDLWSRPLMAAALAHCDMSTVIEGVRTAHGWSQGDLARAVDYSQSWVSRVVNGQQSLTVSQVHDLARRLGIPLHLLRFDGIPAHGGSAGRAQRQGAADAAPGRGYGAVASSGGQRITADQRTAPRCPVDETTAPTLRTATGGQRRMDATAPAHHLLPSAVAHVHLSEQMLGNARGTPFFADLSAAASEASGFAAWLYTDQGDTRSARNRYRAAVIRARQAGMGLLDVYMLGSLAAFETETAEDPELGLGLALEAEHVLGADAHPTARAWLACVRALAHAQMGDHSAARQAIVLAEREVARPGNADPPWPWVFPFDQAKVAGYRAFADVRLRRPHDARKAFTEAFTPAAPGAKQSAVLQVELASAHAEAGDLEEAFRLAQQALETGTRFSSERIIRRVRSFRQRYRAPRASSAQDLDDRLSALVTGTPAAG